MGRRGDAYDNAVARSFFATLVPKGVMLVSSSLLLPLATVVWWRASASRYVRLASIGDICLNGFR